MDRRNILIIVNLAIVILEIIGFALVFKELGTDAFIYYTEDSNLILLISSLVFLAYAFLKKDLPSWFKTLRFTAVVSTTLTFIIVITVLSWMTDWGLFNLLFPIISFVCLEKYDNLNALTGVIFTLLYAIVIIPLNILEKVIGPYPFLMVNTQPVLETVFWIVAIFLITYAIALVLKKGNGKVII